MTEREQKAIEWVMTHCPQEFIYALAERVAEVLRTDVPAPQALAVIEAAQTPAPKSKRFTKPTIEEIRAYCAERGNGVNAESFYNFYEANGWRVGKNPMKDWKASVRTWEQRDGGGGRTAQGAKKNAEWRDPFLEYAKQSIEGLKYD